MQLLPQATSVPGQAWQAPCWHRPLPQTLPQPPQLYGSELVEVQPEPHRVPPPEQAWQAPAMQLCPLQPTPQPPQLPGSLLVSTQPLPQDV